MDTLSLKNKLCRCKPHGIYALSFLLSFLLFLSLLIRMDIAPFGEYTGMTAANDGDVYRSYLTFFRFLKGEGSLFLSASQSGDVCGEIFSVLASPLSYLLFFVKAESLFSALSMISAIKCGLAGAFMAMLLRRFANLPLPFLPALSTLYALGIPTLTLSSGFIYSDFALYLPLLLYLFLRISEKGYGISFALVLALALAADARAMLFYSLVLLFAFCYFPHRRASLLRAFFFTAVGILLSLVAVIPSLFLYTGEVVTVPSRWFTVPWLSALTSLFSGSFFPTDGGAILLSLGTPVLLLLPLFFANRKLPLFRRCASGAFLLLLATGVFLFPIYKSLSLNFIYGQLPPFGALLFLFFAILFVAQGLPDAPDARMRTVSLFSFGGLILSLTLLQKLHRVFLSADGQEYPILDDMHGVWLSIFVGLAATACFYLLSEKISTKAKAATAIALTAVTALSAFLYGHAFENSLLFERTAEPFDPFAEEIELDRVPTLAPADTEEFLAECLGKGKETHPLAEFYKDVPYFFTTAYHSTPSNQLYYAERLNAKIGSVLGTGDPLCSILIPPQFTFPSSENRLTRLRPHSYLKGYHVYYAKKQNASLLFSVIGNGDALYFELPSPVPQSLTVTVNGRPYLYTEGPLYIGTPEKGEELLVTVAPNGLSQVFIPTSGKTFFSVSEKRLDAVLNELQGLSKDVTVGNTEIKATVNASTDTTVMTFLPYDSHFRLEIDGKAAELSKDADGYVTFPLSKGEHTVRLYYRVDGFGVGLSLALFGLLLLLGYCITYPFFTKKKGAANEHHTL